MKNNLTEVQKGILEEALEGKTIEEIGLDEVKSNLQLQQYEEGMDWGGISDGAEANFNEVHRYLNSLADDEETRKQKLIDYITEEYKKIQDTIDVKKEFGEWNTEDIIEYGLEMEFSLLNHVGVAFGFTDKELDQIVTDEELNFYLLEEVNKNIESKKKEVFKEHMTLNELENASIFYGNHDYNNFLNEFQVPIGKLNNDDKFILYKNLYTSAKEGNSYIAELLQKEVKKNGVPQVEINNITKNVIFDSNEQVIAYRGINQWNIVTGSSYTLDKEKAIWFSNRFDEERNNVIGFKVKLKDIIFYDNERKEQEVFLTDEIIKHEM